MVNPSTEIRAPFTFQQQELETPLPKVGSLSSDDEGQTSMVSLNTFWVICTSYSRAQSKAHR